jgi:hypothetical protein
VLTWPDPVGIAITLKGKALMPRLHNLDEGDKGQVGSSLPNIKSVVCGIGLIYGVLCFQTHLNKNTQKKIHKSFRVGVFVITLASGS